MCGLYISNYKNIENETVHLLNRRGPDFNNTLKVENFYITHTLLSMTGEFTKQPLIEEKLAILFNGEIYNYRDNISYKSDVYKIKEAYLNSKKIFFNDLDGEFAIILIDFEKSKLYFGTDIFEQSHYIIEFKNKIFKYRVTRVYQKQRFPSYSL